MMKWVLWLYPRDWRQKYGDEMQDLLETRPITLRTVTDLVLGALDARAQAFGKGTTMNTAESRDRSAFPTLTMTALIGAGATLALVIMSAALYPASVQGRGLTGFLLTVLGVLASGLAAFVLGRQKSPGVSAALGAGARFGLALGVCQILNIALEDFAPLGNTLSIVRGIGMWALLFVAFGAAGSAGFQRTGAHLQGVVASVWSAIVSTLMTVLFGISLSLLCLPVMQKILTDDFAHSGMTDARAFVFANTFESASMHWLAAPVIAVFLGVLGGWATALLQRLHRRFAVTVGVFEVGLLMVGVAALWFGTSLARPDRPPFIMSGLLALSIAMACAYPIVTTLRRPAPSL